MLKSEYGVLGKVRVLLGQDAEYVWCLSVKPMCV
jgi:hypothetical protein